MEYSLRYGKSELALTETALTIGRGTGCGITLDDALVSRHHARIVVRGDAVFVEDLGSRNGVMVNGRRIEKELKLAAGDRVVIGSVEFEILARPARKGGTMTRSTGEQFRTIDGQSPVADLAAPDDATVHTRRPEAFALLGSVVDGALRAGHSEEAERLLHGHVFSLIADVKRGTRVPLDTMAAAARHMVKVAHATKKGIWIDYVVEMYRVEPDVLPADIIDGVVASLPALGRVDVAALRDYVSRIRSSSQKLASADRAAVAKLPDLERAVVLAATRR